MKTSKFTILCLSDSHLGRPSGELDVDTVFEPLYKDMKDAIEREQLEPNLIVFSGNMAYSGKKHEYEIFKEFIEKIYTCFNKRLGEMPIFIVPGNHDVDRKKVDDSQKEFRNNFNTDLVDKMIQRADLTWNRIIERQQNWKKFVKSIPNQPWDLDEQTNLCTGILDSQGTPVGVAGLNSSWASHDDDDRGKLWIGQRQYDKAYRSVKSAPFRIAVSITRPIGYTKMKDL